MNLLTWALMLYIIGVTVFAAINWASFTTSSSLSLIVTSVEAPLGLVMLCLTGIAVMLALLFAAHLKTAMLFESRKHSLEMQAQRKLADATEASRLTELQRVMEARLQENAEQRTAGQIDLTTRLALIEKNLQESIEQSGNTLAAYIGELEDRLEQPSRRP